ncbi:MAG TPA: amidohydrolase family protein, partial [Syntrophomonadaceae bacterium]|nr:amidohydrolase family protein [Syntrophomonadaceae bacterium]
MVYADKLFINGNFYSMKSEHDRFEALAATGDRIVFTGTDLEASQIEANEVIDLNGQTVIPGLNDTHLHFFAYCQNSQSVNLAGAKSIREVIDRLREKAATTPKGEWIRGAELDQTKFAENRFPTRWELDEASKEHPIFISRY